MFSKKNCVTLRKGELPTFFGNNILPLKPMFREATPINKMKLYSKSSLTHICLFCIVPGIGRYSECIEEDVFFFSCKFYLQKNCTVWRFFALEIVISELFFFHSVDPRGITDREVYQEFQPSYDIFHRSRAKGCSDHRFRACTPSLHCPIAYSVSTQSQQSVL